MRTSRVGACASLIALLSGISQIAINGQTLTLPELVERQQTDIAVTKSVLEGSGTFESTLRRTTLIVRGTLGPAVARLTRDKRSIVTTYGIIGPTVLFASAVEKFDKPGTAAPPLTVTVEGGSVRIGNFVATVKTNAYAPMRVGVEMLLLLNMVDGQYRPSDGVGAFEISNGQVMPMLSGRAELKRFAGTDIRVFTERLVENKRALTGPKQN